MECKCFNPLNALCQSPELIDTLWNVNFRVDILYQIRTCELIDTLWNVNHDRGKEKEKIMIELIDTLWNVNILPE